jgi:hypothetical protein
MQGFQNALRNSEQDARRYVNNLLFSDGISGAMTALIREVGVRYARQNYDSLRKEKQFNTSEEWIQLIMEYLGTNFYNNGVLQIVKTSRTMMLDILELGNREGWGYSDYAQYISENVPGLNRNRADMIARTEVGRAIHAGTFVGADKSPFQKQKIWVAAKDNRTRGNPFKGQKDKADHWHLDGQTVDFNDKFVDSRSGTELDHPHDPQAKAVDIIRCRCTFAITNKRDANGRLIRKNTGIVLPMARPSNISIQPASQQEIRRGFVPATTIKEAEDRMKNIGINADFKLGNLNNVNSIIKAIEKENQLNTLTGLKNISIQNLGKNVRGNYTSDGHIRINTNYKYDDGKIGLANDVVKKLQDNIDQVNNDPREWFRKINENLVKKWEKLKKEYVKKMDEGNDIYWSMSSSQPNLDKQLEFTVIHEIGHHRHIFQQKMTRDFVFRKVKSITEYGKTNMKEYYAEWYTYWRANGDKNVPIDLLKLFKSL